MPHNESGSAPLDLAVGGAILDGAPDAIVVIDANGVIVLVNVRTEQLFGYQRVTLIGATVETLLPGSNHAACSARSARACAPTSFGSTGAVIELEGRRSDRSEFIAEVSLSTTDTSRGVLVTAAFATSPNANGPK